MEQLRDGRYIDGEEFDECSRSIYNDINFNADEAE
jgi:hypothetical protein